MRNLDILTKWLLGPIWASKLYEIPTKTSQTLWDMYKYDLGLWLHQISFIWWQNKDQKTEYFYRDLHVDTIAFAQHTSDL